MANVVTAGSGRPSHALGYDPSDNTPRAARQTMSQPQRHGPGKREIFRPDNVSNVGHDSHYSPQRVFVPRHSPLSAPPLQEDHDHELAYPERHHQQSPQRREPLPPRRVSSATSVSTISSISSRESYDSRLRSTLSSRSSVESWDSTMTRQDPAWHRPSQLKVLRKARPGEMFAALPGEVLELILDELKQLHLASSSPTCATCWMRDLCAVSLSSRKYLKYARAAL